MTCECVRPMVFERGRCTKCGRRLADALPERPSSAQTIEALVEVMQGTRRLSSGKGRSARKPEE